MNNKNSSVTLRDVAAATGVDVSTISRVLQNKGRVSEETRTRILETAERLGYHGNPVARALKTAKSSTVLMVVPQIENPIFASAIIGAEIEARSRGFALLVSYDKGDGREIISDISRSSIIEGVIIASFDDDNRLRQVLNSTDLPHVVLNRHLPGDENCVAIDTRRAARMGVEHLIAMGHRRIGHLAGRLGRFNGDMRRRGWEEAMAAAGLDHGDHLIAQAGYSPDAVPAAVDKLLAIGVTAIHAATLLTAAATIARLHERDVRVPEEVSVITMHDDLLARVVYPQVTTVALPSQEMGRVAARRLIDLIQGVEPNGTQSAGSLLLPPDELIIRASVAAL
ncbi:MULTISPECIES: LacI family DNA-binding transcriptional regulator [unclassified Shinella]|jgi:LacI family transcriptional regulator|uniref:LacI family DNA-binding transcriptional regulator n=1 Tax=unclassified Shinella TaxID=2643062 RepID=UPI0003C539CC|nr:MULTISPECIES: LacI family DNA-binding transcriptional regulator [unclassified Shinella]MCA0339406.1 LacI family transcriptional regulator [Pseudomonadota bacterium]OJU94026.1 MAG: hypothetical protein BGO06_27140 [Shinella sp. 65-6]EYR80235.1 transcriptional regulator LacI family [Shinella sp. DD12]MCO5148741.1 LacI family transcriptional regulator [Shinella sp.]MDC7264802.1 LacI family transcriptional regulator [Shinella sp. HY16]